MIYEFIAEGGQWMYPILAVSVLGLTFILERAWFWLRLWLRRDRRLQRRLLNGDPAPAARSHDPRVEVLLDLGRHPEDPALALERAKMLVRDSKAHLKVLAIVASVGSSLGLFGTVVGMSTSFKGVGLNNPEAIVTGLHSALNTTVLGLVVHISCYVFHGLYTQMSLNLSQDLEEQLNQTRRALKSRSAAAPMEPQSAATPRPVVGPQGAPALAQALSQTLAQTAS